MVRLLAVGWLTLVFGFVSGLFVYGAQVWPYPTVKEIVMYVSGHDEEKTSLAKKLANDLDLKPWRHVINSPGMNVKNDQKFHPLNTLPLKSRRTPPMMFLSDKALKGYRVIYGAFDFQDKQSGTILLAPNGQIIHVWQTTQEDVEWEHRPDTNVFPHGFEIFPDGSIVTAYDMGTSLIKYDYCGQMIWKIRGNFHHSINSTAENTIWVWNFNEIENLNYLEEISYEEGTVVRKFTLKDVMEANPAIDIFGIRQIDRPDGSKWVEGGGEQWHPNDIDPLPKELEQYYPGFNAGDLLISLRAPNLIFVMDPESLKVKWWRQGLTRRQHDPDWNERGTITVFNNNMHREYSSILELDPMTFNSKILVDGRDHDFYTWIRGKHQLLPSGEVLITSSQQGRIFEVDAEGNVTFEFVNTYSHDNEVMIVSEARFLPMDFFKELPQCQSKFL